MDEHEVTNAEFRTFVEATGYVTTAETPDRVGGPQETTPARHAEAP